MKVKLSQRQGLSRLQKAGIAVLSAALLAFVAVKVIIPLQSRAASEQSLESNQWIGSKSSQWKDAANWSLGRVPDRGDLVVIHAGGAENTSVEISRREEIEIGALDIRGCRLQIEGDLEVVSYVQAMSKNTQIEVSGELRCSEELILMGYSQLSLVKGVLEVYENTLLENAVCVIEEGEAVMHGAIELRRKGSLLHIKGGNLLSEGDLVLHHSKDFLNRFRVSGGDVVVKGATVFQKTLKDEKIPASLVVDGGRLELNETKRGLGLQGFIPGVYNYQLEGGEIVFHKDVLLDTLKEGDSAVMTLGHQAEVWSEKQKYSRDKEDDMVKVLHKGWVYSLSQSYWTSTGDVPGTADEWELLGKAEEEDESYSLNLVDAWKSSKLYQRSDPNEEVFVAYKGRIYRLSHTCNISKNNAPDKNEWAWLLWHEPGEAEINYEDRFFVSGGTAHFHGAFERWRGFQTYGENTLSFLGDGVDYQLKQGDVYHSLSIGPYAGLKLVGSSSVIGSLSNQSKRSVSGTGTLVFSGSSDQRIMSFQPLVIDRLEMKKDTGTISLRGVLDVQHSLRWTHVTPFVADPSLSSKSNVLRFGPNATVSGAGWYEGAVEKRGVSAFEFPIGKGGKRAAISISASSDTATYRAEYFEYDVPGYRKIASDLNAVSQMEYWTLKSLENGGAAEVTLHWSDGSWSQIEKVADLVVAEFNGNEWRSLGQNSSTGTSRSGAISARASISSASYYTYGSTSNTNAFTSQSVPIRIERQQNGLVFYASDLPSGLRFKEVLLSTDSLFTEYEVLQAYEENGRYEAEFYSQLNAGNGYARIVLENQEGEERWSEIQDLSLEAMAAIRVTGLYPNPVSAHEVSRLSLSSTATANATANVLDAKGALVQQISLSVVSGQSSIALQQLSQLQTGTYQLVLQSGPHRDAVSFIKM